MNTEEILINSTVEPRERSRRCHSPWSRFRTLIVTPVFVMYYMLVIMILKYDIILIVCKQCLSPSRFYFLNNF